MPDRPLDERLALLLGWRRPTAEELQALRLDFFTYDSWWLSPAGKMAPQVPAFSGCWEGAGLVVAHLVERGCKISLNNVLGNQWEIRVQGPEVGQWAEVHWQESVPLGVARAALEALGEENPASARCALCGALLAFEDVRQSRRSDRCGKCGRRGEGP